MRLLHIADAWSETERSYIDTGEASPTNSTLQGQKDMHKIRCSEVWGGIQSREEDLQAAGISVSLYSHAADGDQGGDIYYVSV